MNGWERLAVVIAAPFCILGFILGYDDDRGYGTIAIDQTLAERFADAEARDTAWGYFWGQAAWENHEELQYCNAGTVEGQRYPYSPNQITVTCDIERSHRIFTGIKYAAIPAVIMWLIVLVLGWVIAGFRTSPK